LPRSTTGTDKTLMSDGVKAHKRAEAPKHCRTRDTRVCCSAAVLDYTACETGSLCLNSSTSSPQHSNAAGLTCFAQRCLGTCFKLEARDWLNRLTRGSQRGSRRIRHIKRQCHVARAVFVQVTYLSVIMRCIIMRWNLHFSFQKDY